MEITVPLLNCIVPINCFDNDSNYGKYYWWGTLDGQYMQPLCSIFCLFVFLFLQFLVKAQLSFKSSWHILYTNPLLEMWFTNIFSQSIACLFIFLTGYFTEQSFSFWGSSMYWFFFLLYIVLLVSCVRTLRLMLGHEYFLLCFLLKLYNFIFKSVTQFESIYM